MRQRLIATTAFVLFAVPALAQATTPATMTVNLTSTSFQAASTINVGIVGAGVNGPGHAQVGLAGNMH